MHRKLRRLAVDFVKRIMRHSFVFACLVYMGQDWWRGLRLRRGRIDTTSGVLAAEYDAQATADYCAHVYETYLKRAAIDRFDGTVGEIGPGNTFGIGLLCRAGGAAEYHAIDRFRPIRDTAMEAAVYKILIEKTGRADLLRPDSDSGIDGVQYHVGHSAETFFATSGLRFDAIVSCATLEHCYDPLLALDGMVAALRPGGIMVHVIDLRDHGMFEGRSPLAFLGVPDWAYPRMVRNSGMPNRVMLSDYRDWLAGCGADGRIDVTLLVGGADRNGVAPNPESRDAALSEVRAIRPRLAASLRHHNDEDLAVAGFTLVVRQPR